MLFWLYSSNLSFCTFERPSWRRKTRTLFVKNGTRFWVLRKFHQLKLNWVTRMICNTCTHRYFGLKGMMWTKLVIKLVREDITRFNYSLTSFMSWRYMLNDDLRLRYNTTSLVYILGQKRMGLAWVPAAGSICQ